MSSSSRSRALGALAAIGAVAAAVMALAPAGALGGARAAGTRSVTLRNIRFNPSTVNINRGETVTWLWRDGRTRHNVTFSGFHSRTQTAGSYAVRFTHSGTFNYRCTIHEAEGMRGRIVVH